ncbi:MAG: TrkH family potassium uptake protein [Armatimonadota bacterium]
MSCHRQITPLSDNRCIWDASAVYGMALARYNAAGVFYMQENQPSQAEPTTTPMVKVRRGPRRRLPVILAIALVYLAIIIIGFVLLTLPIAQRPGVSVSWLASLFTSVSATTLTGLTTVNTADTWSPFGQVVILLLIQIGGLGYMTISTIFALLLGLRLGISSRLHLRERQGGFTLRDALKVLQYVALTTLIIEALGAVLLIANFYFRQQLPLAAAVYQGIFTGVSSFCNAGFHLLPSATGGVWAPAFRMDSWMLLIMGLLIIFGGLGYAVIAELVFLRRTRRLSLHTKLVLMTTLVLIIIGWLAFLLFEARNSHTLASMANRGQWVVTSWFMSVTPRTGGFSPVDLAVVSPPTLLILSLLMIIGASPGGTGSGVKTSTAAVIILAIATLLRQRRDIEVFGRRISGENVRLAMSLVSLYLLSVLLVIIAISFTEISLKETLINSDTMANYGRLMFEVVSAFSNVGLSAGVTPTLSPFSQALIMLGMFLGRLGPLTFAFIFAQPKKAVLRRLPDEPVVAG